MGIEDLCVIAYDIASDRRRYRLSRLLEGHGYRIQESVFEAWLSPDAQQQLLDKAAALIDPTLDRVVLYRMSKDDVERNKSLGCAQSTRNPDFHLV